MFHTSAGTDQCQSMAHIAICKSTSRIISFEPIHVFSINYHKFAQRKLLLSSDIEINPGHSDMDTVLCAAQASENNVK